MKFSRRRSRSRLVSRPAYDILLALPPDVILDFEESIETLKSVRGFERATCPAHATTELFLMRSGAFSK